MSEIKPKRRADSLSLALNNLIHFKMPYEMSVRSCIEARRGIAGLVAHHAH